MRFYFEFPLSTRGEGLPSPTCTTPLACPPFALDPDLVRLPTRPAIDICVEPHRPTLNEPRPWTIAGTGVKPLGGREPQTAPSSGIIDVGPRAVFSFDRFHRPGSGPFAQPVWAGRLPGRPLRAATVIRAQGSSSTAPVIDKSRRGIETRTSRRTVGRATRQTKAAYRDPGVLGLSSRKRFVQPRKGHAGPEISERRDRPGGGPCCPIRGPFGRSWPAARRLAAIRGFCKLRGTICDSPPPFFSPGPAPARPSYRFRGSGNALWPGGKSTPFPPETIRRTLDVCWSVFLVSFLRVLRGEGGDPVSWGTGQGQARLETSPLVQCGGGKTTAARARRACVNIGRRAERGRPAQPVVGYMSTTSRGRPRRSARPAAQAVIRFCATCSMKLHVGAVDLVAPAVSGVKRAVSPSRAFSTGQPVALMMCNTAGERPQR